MKSEAHGRLRVALIVSQPWCRKYAQATASMGNMFSLLEKALEKVTALPPYEQDLIASQILASLADEEAWKRSFTEKRDLIRRMARQAPREDEREGTLPLDYLL